MPQQTAHYQLEKPLASEVADISVLNNNFDDIDTAMYENQQRSEGALNDLADAFSTASTYAVGDLCIYQNQLYKCTMAITTAGAWDSTKWTATTLADEIGDGMHTYSTSEQVVGTWIDGKPIYEKTIDIGSLPNNSMKQVNHGIINLNNVIDVKGAASDGTAIVPLPFVNIDALVNQMMISVTSTYINIKTGTTRSAFSGYVTILYTKTTD